jgi:haloalkane dehalogenase
MHLSKCKGRRKGWISMNFTEHFVQRDQYRIHVREYAGEEPAIILVHGFPDNLHPYDRLLRYLRPARRDGLR